MDVIGKGYENKKENDYRIDKSKVLEMSKLTYALLDCFDYNQILKKRQENFRYAREVFDKINLIDISKIADSNCAPMGYPLLIDEVEIIPEFHKEHIYQARYWEYIINDFEEDTLEYRLAKHLALICTDQRYGKKEIDLQYNIVEGLLNN